MTPAEEIKSAAECLHAESAVCDPPHPVGEPLALLLDAVAFAIGMDADMIHRVGYDHALAVARAINGRST